MKDHICGWLFIFYLFMIPVTFCKYPWPQYQCRTYGQAIMNRAVMPMIGSVIWPILWTIEAMETPLP